MPTRREINSEEKQPEILKILKLGTVSKCGYCCISGRLWNKKIGFINLGQYTTMILLQIVMLSPGTHLVKNQESLWKSNVSQFKKKKES